LRRVVYHGILRYVSFIIKVEQKNDVGMKIYIIHSKIYSNASMIIYHTNDKYRVVDK